MVTVSSSPQSVSHAVAIAVVRCKQMFWPNPAGCSPDGRIPTLSFLAHVSRAGGKKATREPNIQQKFPKHHRCTVCTCCSHRGRFRLGNLADCWSQAAHSLSGRQESQFRSPCRRDHDHLLPPRNIARCYVATHRHPVMTIALNVVSKPPHSLTACSPARTALQAAQRPL